METTRPSLRRADLIFWSCWALALILKLDLATLFGTMDVLLYSKYGATLAHSDFATAYASSDIYNIPPLAAGYSALLTVLVGPATNAFGFALKLPGILAEAVFAVVLWKRFGKENGLRKWIAPLFVLNPLALAITGFHGNLDGLLAVFLGAALLMAMDDRPLACGIWLGLATNLKVSPILLGPAFFCWWLARGRPWPFTLAAGATVLVGWSPGLIACPGLFLERVIAYSSLWGTWGISRLLYLSGAPDFHVVQYGAPAGRAKLIAAGLKGMVILAACGLAWRRRRLPAIGLAGTVAAVWTVFFVLAPGGAAQYLVWLVLPLLLYDVRFALAYLAASTPFMVIFYPAAFAEILPLDPYPVIRSLWPQVVDSFSWTWPALLAWAALTALLLWEGRQWWDARQTESVEAG